MTGNRLEDLGRDRKGRHSIRIDDQANLLYLARSSWRPSACRQIVWLWSCVCLRHVSTILLMRGGASRRIPLSVYPPTSARLPGSG
jgi:hypothetical protein